MKENKSRQATIAVTPTVYETAKQYAQKNRRSFNDLVQMLLENYIEQERKKESV